MKVGTYLTNECKRICVCLLALFSVPYTLRSEFASLKYDCSPCLLPNSTTAHNTEFYLSPPTLIHAYTLTSHPTRSLVDIRSAIVEDAEDGPVSSNSHSNEIWGVGLGGAPHMLLFTSRSDLQNEPLAGSNPTFLL
jgi:hypothetical protein